MTINISGPSLARVDRNSPRYKFLQQAHQAIAAKDPMTWGPQAAQEAAIRLNWVDLPSTSLSLKMKLPNSLANSRIRTMLFSAEWVDHR